MRYQSMLSTSALTTILTFMPAMPAASATLEGVLNQSQTLVSPAPLGFSESLRRVKSLADGEKTEMDKKYDLADALAGCYGFKFDRNKIKSSHKNSFRLDYLSDTIILEYALASEAGSTITTLWIKAGQADEVTTDTQGNSTTIHFPNTCKY